MAGMEENELGSTAGRANRASLMLLEGIGLDVGVICAL